GTPGTDAAADASVAVVLPARVCHDAGVLGLPRYFGAVRVHRQRQGKSRSRMDLHRQTVITLRFLDFGTMACRTAMRSNSGSRWQSTAEPRHAADGLQPRLMPSVRRNWGGTMRACTAGRVVLSVLAFILACTPALAQSPPPGLILQADEGERRARRTGDFPFILKVDKKNGGSTDMVMGMEDLKPGQAIPTHRHLHADEIVFIHKGTAEVTLGEQKAVVREGGTVYIPRNVRIALKNPGPA